MMTKIKSFTHEETCAKTVLQATDSNIKFVVLLIPSCVGPDTESLGLQTHSSVMQHPKRLSNKRAEHPSSSLSWAGE